MRRHEARQYALQALYQIDVGKIDPTPAVKNVLEDVAPITDTDVTYIAHLVNGTQAHVLELDELLEKHVEGWKIDRIARVDLNVLRLALFELLFEKDVDIATIVNEAVELAKKFSAEPSSKFVNGVLSRLIPLAAERRG